MTKRKLLIIRLYFCAATIITFISVSSASHVDDIKSFPTSTPYRVSVKREIWGRVSNDGFVSLEPLPAEIKGKVVYATTVNNWPFVRHLTSLSLGNGLEEDKSSFRHFALEESQRTASWLFQPQISPNGEKLLVKWGDPFERRAGFTLLVVDLNSQEVETVAGLTFQFSLWSPDSTRIAFVRGGDVDGNVEGDEKLTLCTYDLKRKIEKKVVEDNGVRNSVSWTRQNTLLYSKLVLNPNKSARNDLQQRLDIYESDADGQNSKLIVQDGYRPMPSPDGRWIAFFGSEVSTRPTFLSRMWWYDPKGAALSVIRRDGTGRKALNREESSYPLIRWAPDSKSFFAIKTTTRQASAEGLIQEWSIGTGNRRTVASLQAKDVEVIPREEAYPFFCPLEVTHDGKFLPIVTFEFGPVKHALYERNEFLQFIELKTGKIHPTLRLKDTFGLDWRENPASH